MLLRTIAADVVALDHKRFALAGHDRGALIAFRAGLDHPETVTHPACLAILPTLDICDATHGTARAPPSAFTSTSWLSHPACPSS